MPYRNVEEAKDAGFPTTIGGVGLTLAQINHLAKIHDAVKKSGSGEEPMAVATSEWKEQYRKDGDKWTAQTDYSGSVWIPVAKAGQKNRSGKELTDEAMATSYATLRGGRVTINHLASMNGVTIQDVKHESPFMYMKFDSDTEKIFIASDSSGRSIEVENEEWDGDRIIGFDGGGISVLYPGHNPACTRAMGCFEFDDGKAPTEGGITIMETKEIKESIATGIASGIEGLKKDLTTMFEKKPPESGGDNMNELTDMTVKFEAAEKKSVETATELTTLKIEFEQTKTASDVKDTEIADLKNKATEFEAAKTTEIDALNETVAKFEAAETVTLEAKKTEQFEAMLNSVPLGQKDTDEKKTALRTEFDGDPTALALKVMAFEKMPATDEEGIGFEGESPEGDSNGFTVGDCKGV